MLRMVFIYVDLPLICVHRIFQYRRVAYRKQTVIASKKYVYVSFFNLQNSPVPNLHSFNDVQENFSISFNDFRLL